MILTAAPPAQALVANAIRQGYREKKGVLVTFEASWCPWCRRLDRLIAAEPGFRRSYVLVRLTVRERDEKRALENPGWADLMRKWRRSEDQDVPYLVWLDRTGKKVADSYRAGGEIPSNAGYPRREPEIRAFVATLRTTGKFRPAELARIARAFRNGTISGAAK